MLQKLVLESLQPENVYSFTSTFLSENKRTVDVQHNINVSLKPVEITFWILWQYQLQIT